jgi:CheY-like chemotaxis protein
MNAILGMTELILRHRLPPEAAEEAQNIQQAGKNLLAIINDILDFSKIESGKLDIIPVEYRFDSLVNDVLSIIKMRLSEKQLLFITRIDASLPLVLAGDEVRVRQVLLNLLSNAVKYTREGFIRFDIRAIPPEEGEDGRIWLLFEVADTGVGIKAGDQDRLFGEFVQFDPRQNRGIEGTGLGLAISRNLCRLMGGDITLESVYGQGSVFRAVIPQEVRDASPFAAVPAAASQRVLVYEDRREPADALVYTVERLGVPCVLAQGPGELAVLLRGEPFDYVLAGARLFEEVETLLQKQGLAAKAVYIPDYGEDGPERGTRVLSVPVQPLTIARLLSGEVESPIVNSGAGLRVKFTAPAARILVVDDINTNLKVAEGLLAPYGAVVDICLSGPEAIELVKTRPYDLVFMDHMMPGMDGIETTALIRAWEGERPSVSPAERFPGEEPPRPVPVIALTANAVSGMREMFLQKGFSDYLSKPIELAKLEDIMARWIPREKRILERGGSPASAKPGSSVTIPGVDTERGIALTGGTPAGYLKVLALFLKDLEDRLPLFHLPPGEAPGDLAVFTIQVHALKSAAASIGAADISAQAARFEAAGRAGDRERITAELPSFAGNLEKLGADIREALNTRPTAPDTPPLGEGLPLLRELGEALGARRLADIDRLLTALEGRLPGSEGRELLDALSDAVLMTEFERGAGLIRDFFEKIR